MGRTSSFLPRREFIITNCGHIHRHRRDHLGKNYIGHRGRVWRFKLECRREVVAQSCSCSCERHKSRYIGRSDVRYFFLPPRIKCWPICRASVDLETDQRIQHTIQTEFKDRTLICIARKSSSQAALMLMLTKVVFRSPQDHPILWSDFGSWQW